MQHQHPVWSADGRRLAYLRAPLGAGQIVVRAVARGVEISVEMPPTWDQEAPTNVLTTLTWAPGTVILAAVQTPAGTAVWRLDPDGGLPSLLLDQAAWSLQPVWSPDGGRIALFSDHEGGP